MTLVYSTEATTEEHIDNLERLLDRRNPDAGDVRARLTRLEAQMKDIRLAQDDISEQLGSVATVLAAGKGAFQVLDVIGKIAKPLLWLGAVVAGLAAVISNHKMG